MSNQHELPNSPGGKEDEAKIELPQKHNFVELSKSRAVRDEEWESLDLSGLLGRYYLDDIFMLRVLMLYSEHTHQDLDEITHEDRERIYDGLRATLNVGEGGGYIIDMPIEGGDTALVSFVATDEDLAPYVIH